MHYKRKRFRYPIFIFSAIILLITIFMFGCICMNDNAKQQKFEISDSFETTIKDQFGEN